MTTIIKNGTIVTADLTYPADILIEHGKITAIGPNLKGDTTLDASGCYVMPGGIDPHTHLEMPFMGTYSADDFESGTRAALSGGTTMVVDFVLPGQGQGLMDAAQMWHNKSGRAHCDYSFHMAITGWNERIFDEMKTVVQDKGINTFKHFMAYKGALMVNDDEMFASFQRCAELGALPDATPLALRLNSPGGSVFGVGKYLSPKLYVSYGVSLLGTGQVLTLKYLLRKGFDIEIESSTVENRASVNWRTEK